MKETDFNKKIEKRDLNIFELFSSDNLNNSIKELLRPRFLGSIHLKNSNPSTNSIGSVENLFKGKLELEINKSLKNLLLNPITKILIVLMICFNIIWLFFLFIL